ncbi:MAG: SulP family inorganic anion transporter [Acidimicrobiales bacterium]
MIPVSGRAERRARFAGVFFPTIRGYQASALGPDLLAGLLLAAIALPEQIATARLAGMPTTAGLAAFIFGSLAIAIFGRTRTLSVGGDSTIAPVIAASVTSIVASGSATYRADASLLALMVGLVVAVVGIARMAWLADILSRPVVTGFLAGVGIAIVLKQLPSLFGVEVAGHPGQVGIAYDTLKSLGHANGWAIGIAAVVLVGVGGADRWNKRFPGALIALVGSTAVVAIFGLKTHGLAVLGTVPSGLPHFAAPASSFAAFGRLVLPAIAISLVVLAQSAATVRGIGNSAVSGSTFSDDLVGIGTGSLLAGFTGSFAVDASPPRTAIVSDAGGQTQLSSLSAAAIVLVFAAVAAGLLDDVPYATLGAILALIGARLVNLPELRTIFRFDRVEFGLAFITLCVVALVNVEIGMGLAVVLSVADRARRTARPRDGLLGRLPGTSSWVLSSPQLQLESLPGVVVYFLAAPIWFANADNVASRLISLASSGTGVKTLVLDGAGIPDIDYTGSRALLMVARQLTSEGVTIRFARLDPNVEAELKRAGIFAITGGRSHLSVDEAVTETAPTGPPSPAAPGSAIVGT